MCTCGCEMMCDCMYMCLLVCSLVLRRPRCTQVPGCHDRFLPRHCKICAPRIFPYVPCLYMSGIAGAIIPFPSKEKKIHYSHPNRTEHRNPKSYKHSESM